MGVLLGMSKRPRARSKRDPPRLRVCPFRDSVALPELTPRRGELWRLCDGQLARVHLVSVTMVPRLSYAYVRTRMHWRNVPLQAFRSGYRCEQAELW